MNLKVNQDKCIGCGQCVSICEDVFNFNDEGLAEVIETPIKEEYLEDARLQLRLPQEHVAAFTVALAGISNGAAQCSVLTEDSTD